MFKGLKDFQGESRLADGAFDFVESAFELLDVEIQWTPCIHAALEPTFDEVLHRVPKGRKGRMDLDDFVAKGLEGLEVMTTGVEAEDISQKGDVVAGV